MSDNRQNNFIKGAAILTAAGLIAKVMGFVYRIVLTRIIGPEGIGLYQIAYPIYTTLLVVSRSGIPIALAKLISEKISIKDRKSAFKIFKVGRRISIIVGLFFSILMAVLARPLTIWFDWGSEAYYPVLAISPAIFFVSIMATYRGFFQGLQNMVPTAVSQVVEQFVRMITMIALAYLLISRSLSHAAAGATFGAVTGSFAGLLVLLYIYYNKRKDIWKFIQDGSKNVKAENTKKIVKSIAVLGIPITLGALVQPLMNLVDTMIVPMRLRTVGILEPMAIFGEFTGVAMVLVNFPTIITISLAASLVPAISEAYTLKKEEMIRRKTEKGLRVTILITLPAAVGLFILALPLTTVIFAVPEAASILRIVAWSVFFIGIYQTSSGILNGMGKTKIPAFNLLIGAVLNAVINYILTGLPQFGIKGAALGTLTGFAVASFLNLIFVKRDTGFKISFKEFILKPLTAVFIMGVFTRSLFPQINNLFSSFTTGHYTAATFTAVLAAAIVYFFILILIRGIKYNDLLLIPGLGRKIAGFLKKIGLVK